MRIKWKDQIGKTINGFYIKGYKRENNRSFVLTVCPYCKLEKWLRVELVLQLKSCGCYNTQHNFYKKEDLTGRKFNYLTAEHPTDRRTDNGSVIWECSCKCGNTAYISAIDLKRGRVQSCGCFRDEIRRENGKKLGQNTKDICIEGTNPRNLVAKIPKNNTSGYKGVGWDENREKWIARIGFKGTFYLLGRFKDKEEAHEVRLNAEDHLFGDFLQWYAKEYPEEWEKIKGRKKKND